MIRKTKAVVCRFTPDEHANLKQQAQNAGVTLSDYLRNSLDNQPPLKSKIRFSDEDIKTRKSLIIHIKKIGNNLNQISKKSNMNKINFNCLSMVKELIEIERQIDEIMALSLKE